MSKRDSYIPPVLKQDAGLNNSVIRRRKRANALKHGIFSDAALIPGEDPREFDELLAGSMEEWKPSGPTLRDAVVELADLKWKLRRLRKYIQTRLSAMTLNPRSSSFNETYGNVMFIHYLRSEPETCFDEHAKKYLRAKRIDHLKQKFPRSNYQATAEWVNAIIGEILSPSVTPEFDASKLGDQADEYREASRQWKADCNVAGTMMDASEILESELKETERLNAMIVKQTRHCAELKLWEESRSRT
jgi:hypothetical protein